MFHYVTSCVDMLMIMKRLLLHVYFSIALIARSDLCEDTIHVDPGVQQSSHQSYYLETELIMRLVKKYLYNVTYSLTIHFIAESAK